MLKRMLYRIYERRLLGEVRRHPAPKHLGLIQDGHRRYCRKAGLPDLEAGYRLGGAKAAQVLGWCRELGIPLVTLWWLSTENLLRQPEEVGAVLRVIEAKMAEWSAGGLAQRLGMRMVPIGKLDLLPTSTQEALRTAEGATRGLDGMTLNVAVGYGGRQEIIDAVRSYLRHAATQGLTLEEIASGLSLETLDRYVYTHDCPDPDLIIRTSGEVRLSGFMLWQSAYSEFYFCDAYWPAFRKIDFLRAIRNYQQRGRRYGK